MVSIQNQDVHSKNEDVHDQVPAALDWNAVIDHRHVSLLHGPPETFDFTKHGGHTDFPLVKACAVNPELTLYFRAFHSDQGKSHIGPLV